MEWVEATGRSETEAKDAALDLLGVAGDEADFEVLAEAEKGLFGRLKQEARVRARVRPVQPRPKAESGRRNDRNRNRNKSGGNNRNKGEGGGGNNRNRNKSGGNNRNQGDKGGGNRNKGEGGGGRDGGNSQPRRDAAPREAAPAADTGRRAAPVAASVGAAAASEPRSTRREPRESTGEEVSLTAQAGIVSDFLSGLSEAFGLSGEVSTITVDDETLEVQLNGDDLGLLIGPRGNTLRCVQDLARTVVQRQGDREPGRVRVDVAMYYAERRASLERFTRDLAAKVVESGEELALEPMRAADRKVVHDTVGDIEGVDTISEGSDPDRRVVLIPAE